ncbi:hypothetical protein LCGC14_2624950, partial [marine sediment metagenome]
INSGNASASASGKDESLLSPKYHRQQLSVSVRYLNTIIENIDETYKYNNSFL